MLGKPAEEDTSLGLKVAGWERTGCFQMDALNGTLGTAINATIDAKISMASINGSVDASFVLFSGYLVFIMQAGFAAFVAGSVRSKHVSTSMCAVMLITCVSALGFYMTGYGFAFGVRDNGDGTFSGNSFIGSQWFALSHMPRGNWYLWIFQYAFAAVTCQIAMGALVERTQMVAVVVFTLMLSGFTYPVIVHWLWSTTGWASMNRLNGALLFKAGVIDFAGSGCVHMTGGVAALCGSVVLGPRIGRFRPAAGNGKLRRVETLYQPSDFSKAWFVLGILLLWFGWYGFNPGSALAITPYTDTVINCAVTTTMAAAAAGLSAQASQLALARMGKRPHGDEVWDGMTVANGCLAGLVAITSGCSVVYPWAAVIIGIIAGMLYMAASLVFPALGVDDPMDVISTHTVPGIWGALSPGIFAAQTLVTAAYGFVPGTTDELRPYGWIMGGSGNLFAASLVTEFAIIGWVCATMIPTFLALKYAGLFRTSEEAEMSVR